MRTIRSYLAGITVLLCLWTGCGKEEVARPLDEKPMVESDAAESGRIARPVAAAPEPDVRPESPSAAPIRPSPKSVRPHAAREPIAKRVPQPVAAPPQPKSARLMPSPRPMAAPQPVAVAPQPMSPASEPPPSESPARAATESSHAESEDEAAGDYAVVKVFYGTDRAVKGQADSARMVTAGRLRWTLYGAGLTMILVVVARRLYRTAPMRILAWASGSATVVLGIWTAYPGVQHAMERPASDRPKLAYGNQRGNRLQLGTCEVSIPKDHRVGEVESPSILRLEFRENPERHVVLLDVLSTPADEFYSELKDCIEKSAHCGAFVFVHGFNVTFEDAARRTAQIAYDLKFEGAPIFYSWPSHGSLSGYTVDEATVKVTARHLKQFLLGVAQRSGNRRIHLIAHSMGNRALTSALRDLSFLDDQARPKFHEVVLTAPDIDADLFRDDIAPAIVKTAGRVTLYASSNDKALVYSKQVHGYPRAGDSGNSLVVIPGVDTIDVSAVDTSLLGHSYYGSNDTVLADLFDLLHGGKKPDDRKWLRAEAFGALKYWVFQNAMTTARERSPVEDHPSTHIH